MILPGDVTSQHAEIQANYSHSERLRMENDKKAVPRKRAVLRGWRKGPTWELHPPIPPGQERRHHVHLDDTNRAE